MNETPKVLVIIPAYNEEGSIAHVIQRIQSVSDDIDVVVINDGSRDATVEVARAAGATAVIDLPFNLGIGGAMQTGYLYAHKNDYDIALQIDADGQHDPFDIPKVIEPILRGEVNFTVGSRWVEKTAYKSSAARRVGMVIFSRLIKWVTGQVCKDPTSGFRAADKRVIEMFANYYPVDYPEVEVLVHISRRGLKFREIAVEMSERQAGSSSITPIKSIYYMVKVGLAVLISATRKEGAL
ncbi:glycosyltransferase family 2 protein [Tumebacillus sp. ITR2]|uniref:Glycosyltransferase family 2 protein n=1 Tax=Tumebacillus amylolyticus TaxID=2801339 RepID=A0ABS1JFN3_9BACL|nr:glycosyltransferase family 2 protein [Tumebacillus amylolyticus]MBL0389030.1 glycosyltransferase family 2 protein [Tumebacillus amylolyticus]